MKAVWYNSFGKANEVMEYGDIEMPEPQPNEVLVRLHASGVNPSDVKKRAGANPNLLDNGFIIPNSDGAGIIKNVGENVKKNRIGERVWVYNGQYGRRLGTSAEYIAIDEEQCNTLPNNTSFEIGACLAIPAMTAHRCVLSDGNVSGQIILITGGAGRVGYYAIQWAKLYGATVIATASSDKSINDCLEAGADLVVNHPNPESVNEILSYTKNRKIDRIVEGDFGLNLEYILNVVKTGGVITTYSSMTIKEPKIPFIRMMFMNLTVRFVLVYELEQKQKDQAVQDIYQALKQNKLKHRIDKTFSLSNSAKAQEYIESGRPYGCVILTI